MNNYLSKFTPNYKTILFQIETMLEQQLEEQRKQLKRLDNAFDYQLIHLESFKNTYFNKLDEVNSWLKTETENLLQLNLIVKTEEYEGLIMKKYQLKITSFQIHFINKNQLHYVYNGEILHKFQNYYLQAGPEIITNLELIKNLRWVGKQGKDFLKVGLWTAIWKDKPIKEFGGQYTQKGQKQGIWKEMIKNYYDNAQVYEVGEYEDDYRRGTWKYYYQDNVIGGGQYDQKGIRQRKWIELSDRFWVYSQIAFSGEYSKKGQKVGLWDIWYKEEKNLIRIGGGCFSENGSVKIGKWTELSEEFCCTQEVIFIGEYNQCGNKIGLWDILYRQNSSQSFEYIGGGLYICEENQKKFGKWIELSKEFRYEAKITYNGEYNMKGMKVGRWDIMYCKCSEFQYKQIGGGSYDQEGNEKKIGKWIELDDEFYSGKQVTYHGEYNMKAEKVGRWDIWYCKQNEKFYKQMKQRGGGSYDYEGNQIKIGKWIELDDEFSNSKQLTYCGEYNLKAIKVGRWDIQYCKSNEKTYKQIGGGSYDYEGNEKKIGKWIELDDEFYSGKQVTYHGEYNMKAEKVGRWDIKLEKTIIGGGSYSQEEYKQKIGQWVELLEGFNFYKQIKINGEYNIKGRKVGRWDISYFKDDEKKYIQIGGGSYDEEGNQQKTGKWVELDKDFTWGNKIINIGEYNQKGVKTGTWVEINMSIDQNKIIKEVKYVNE